VESFLTATINLTQLIGDALWTQNKCLEPKPLAAVEVPEYP